MEKLLETAVTQVPSLAVLVVVVMVFLKHITKISTDFKTALSEQRLEHREAMLLRDKHAEKVAEDCHRVSIAAVDALKDNTRVMNRMEVHLAARGV